MPGPVGSHDDGTQLPTASSGPAVGLPYPGQPPQNMPNLPPSVVYPPAGAKWNPVPTAQFSSQPQPQPQPAATNIEPKPVSLFAN